MLILTNVNWFSDFLNSKCFQNSIKFLIDSILKYIMNVSTQLIVYTRQEQYLLSDDTWMASYCKRSDSYYLRVDLWPCINALTYGYIDLAKWL